MIAAHEVPWDSLHCEPASALCICTRVGNRDPYFPRLPKTRRYDFRLASVELTAETLSQFDAAVIATDHSSYDYAFVVRHARLVLDARNATRRVTEFREKIVHC